jgi:hypothetical protein
MKKLKENQTAKEYCKGKAIHFAEILEYAYGLEFEEEPDYNFLRFMLKKIVLNMDMAPKKCFEWKNHGNNAEG